MDKFFLVFLVYLILAAILSTLEGCAGTKPAPARTDDGQSGVVTAPRLTPERSAPALITKVVVPPPVAFVSIYFDFDKSNIREDQRPILAGYVDRIKAGSVPVSLEGHCDERGTVEYNLALGQRRADSVKAYLVKAGIDSHKLRTMSHGEGSPADAGHDEQAWARNRRVEFVVIE